MTMKHRRSILRWRRVATAFLAIATAALAGQIVSSPDLFRSGKDLNGSGVQGSEEREKHISEAGIFVQFIGPGFTETLR
jgi:hypothetical protein